MYWQGYEKYEVPFEKLWKESSIATWIVIHLIFKETKDWIKKYNSPSQEPQGSLSLFLSCSLSLCFSLALSHALSLSLSLSLSQRHTVTIHLLTCPRYFVGFFCIAILRFVYLSPLSPLLTHTHTHALHHTYSLLQTHSFTHTPSLTQTLTLSQTLALSHRHSHTHSLILTLSNTHSLSHLHLLS